MEIDGQHLFSVLGALETLARRVADGRAEKCNCFGITQSLIETDKSGTAEGKVRTFLIMFKADPYAGMFNIREIEDHSHPNGSLLYFYDDKGDMVTQAALTGDPIVDMPKELNDVFFGEKPPEENNGQL